MEGVVHGVKTSFLPRNNKFLFLSNRMTSFIEQGRGGPLN